MIFDNTVQLADYVASCVRSANHHIRNTGKVRQYLTIDAARLSVQSVVADIRNCLLYGLLKRRI